MRAGDGLSRRRFLARSAGVSLTATGLAVFGPGVTAPAARGAQPGGRHVLIEDMVDARGLVAARRPVADPDPTSGTLTAQRPFSHVGLHWYGSAEVPVELQTSQDGLAWTAWRRVWVERRPGETPHPDETFGALLGVPRHRFVRYRFASRSAAVGDVTATCLNSLDGPRVAPAQGRFQGVAAGLAVPAARADGADFRTGVLSREQWEADESLRFTPGGQLLWEPAYVAPRMVVVHHTATANDYADAAAEVRAIYAYHAVTEGFGDIGYNALIDRDGRIYEGRRGRDDDPFGRFDRDVLSFGVVAGHAFDYNYGSVGIALLGNYQEGPPAPRMLERLEDLLVFEHGRHQIEPRARRDFARASRLWRYELPGMSGHRDCNNTECPGDAVYMHLDRLRDQVAERLDAGYVPVRSIVEAPPDRNVWVGPAGYAWAGRPPYDCVLEGFQREIGQDLANHLVGYDEHGLPEHITTPQSRATFALQQPGQYTLHLRPSGSAFADQQTVLVDRHVVLDNADDGIERRGAWVRSRNVLEFYGSDYELAEPGSGAEFVWTLAPPEPGRYTVQACWAAGSDRSRAAPYRFGPMDGELRGARVDQQRNGGVWVDLGTAELDANQPCRIELSTASDGVVIADAVRLLLADP
jgi:hypothetical protein